MPFFLQEASFPGIPGSSWPGIHPSLRNESRRFERQLQLFNRGNDRRAGLDIRNIGCRLSKSRRCILIADELGKDNEVSGNSGFVTTCRARLFEKSGGPSVERDADRSGLRPRVGEFSFRLKRKTAPALYTLSLNFSLQSSRLSTTPQKFRDPDLGKDSKRLEENRVSRKSQTSELPSLHHRKEGWPSDQENAAKPPLIARPGWFSE